MVRNIERRIPERHDGITHVRRVLELREQKPDKTFIPRKSAFLYGQKLSTPPSAQIWKILPVTG
jgi:hypothetical protein